MWLAIDLSSDMAGLALMEGDALRGQRSWKAVRRGGDPLFEHWQDLLDETGIESAQIDRIVVGLGPGNYTGLRTALAAARLWALPGQVTVTGVGSSLAMAVNVAATLPPDTAASVDVAVVGDARRDSLWITNYPAPVGLGSPEQVPAIVSRSEGFRQLARFAVWVSADGERLAGLPETILSGMRPVSGSCAATLGRIAWHRQCHGLASAPLRPVYLQPAAMPPSRP